MAMTQSLADRACGRSQTGIGSFGGGFFEYQENSN